MDEIRSLVWRGTLNVQLTIKPSLLVADVISKQCALNVRIPRNNYLPTYLPFILSNFRKHLQIDIDESNQVFWFEFESVPLFWNYPVGVLYDSMTCLNPSERIRNDDENSLSIWKLELVHGSEAPSGVIPLVGGTEQIQNYWMHQWKQACFVLNGSSRQMMSLSMHDSKRFWKSVVDREQKSFEAISSRVVPFKPRFIPLVIHQSLPEMKIVQPVVSEFKKDGSKMQLVDILKTQFPELFQTGTKILMKMVSNGIEIPLSANLYELYLRFMTFDGFLHLSICLSSNIEYPSD